MTCAESKERIYSFCSDTFEPNSFGKDLILLLWTHIGKCWISFPNRYLIQPKVAKYWIRIFEFRKSVIFYIPQLVCILGIYCSRLQAKNYNVLQCTKNLITTCSCAAFLCHFFKHSHLTISLFLLDPFFTKLWAISLPHTLELLLPSICTCCVFCQW